MNRNLWWAVGAVLAALLLIWAFSSYAHAGTVRLCTGASDGNYAQAGDMIAKAKNSPSLTIQVVKDTGGTWGNIERTVSLDPSDPSACDAMIGQPDGPALLKREEPAKAAKLIKVGDLHREYLHVLCNKEADIGELEDLEGDSSYSVAVGAEGSGGWLVWQNFIAEDSDYDAIVAKNIGGIDAVADVAFGGTTCMLVPAGLRNGTVLEAGRDFGDQVTLVQAQDKDFNDAVAIDGKPLYTFSEIPGDAYEESFTAGWGGAVDTISWRAEVYVNPDRVSAQDKSALIRAVAQARKQAIAAFGGE